MAGANRATRATTAGATGHVWDVEELLAKGSDILIHYGVEVTCPSCGIESPPSNQFCCRCGAAMQRKMSPVLVWCLGLIAVIGCLALIGFFVLVCVSISSSNKTTSLSGLSTPQPNLEPGPQWSYTTDVDTMGRRQSFANITSTNTLFFDFPYQGSQHGTLVVRKSTHWGTNVMVRIEHGQFLCGIENCAVNVRFDSGPIQQFSASEPGDHSTTALFLNNEARFISQLRKAKVVRVEATFFREGSQALEFKVEGFKWQ